MLGISSRQTHSFKTPSDMTRLLCTHIRCRLESGYVVWNVLSATDCSWIESVQKILIRGLYDRHCGRRRSYGKLLEFSFIECLSTRHGKRDVMFLNKLVGSNIGCVYLLMNLYFHVPQRFGRPFLLFFFDKSCEVIYANEDAVSLQ